MRRSPLFFGTPSQPSQCGTLTYLHNESAFPALGPVQAFSPEQATSSMSSISHRSTPSHNYLRAVLQPSTMPPTDLSPCAAKPSMSRKDCQFQVQCEQLDAKLEAYQHDGAKTILANMYASEHSDWLKRLRHCLTNDVPMTKPTPAPKKQYYKRSFRTYYIDTFQPPTMVPYVTVLPQTKPTPYNYWTHAAIFVYGDSHTGSDRHTNATTQKPKCVRPSSYVKTLQLSQSAQVNTAPLLDEHVVLPTISGSRHTYQYLTHRKQHDAYNQFLLSEDITCLGYTSLQKNKDSIGTFRAQQRHLHQSLDLYLRRELNMQNTDNWLPVLQQATTLLKLLRTMEPTKRRLRVAKSTASTGLNVSTHTAVRGSCSYYIGIGIDHLKPAHRLQKRYRRHIAFVQSIARSQNSHPSCAPASRLHGTDVVLAKLLHEAAIAPLDFRQHRVSYPNLHDDYSKHMGNLIFTDGGIFIPLSLSPHVVINPSFASTSSAPNFGLHTV